MGNYTGAFAFLGGRKERLGEGERERERERGKEGGREGRRERERGRERKKGSHEEKAKGLPSSWVESMAITSNP